MNYALAVLTHGDHADWLERTLGSFHEHVTPKPASTIIHRDDTSEGFAGATATLWGKAARAEADHVFWLEHDMVITRPVDLDPIGNVLDAHPHLAQMALYREPVTVEEQQAGGYLKQRAELFEDRGGWFEQQSWWTTNPSLMRRHTLAWHPWPRLPDCETAAAKLALMSDPSIRFGVWGHGETHVRHIGVRDGHGY